MTTPTQDNGLPVTTSGRGATGYACDRRANHTIFLVYEPRQEPFTVYVSGVHEFHAQTGQRIRTHAPSTRHRRSLRKAVTEVCQKLADHGLSEPRWTGDYVLLGEHVKDRDWVLLQIANRIHELSPGITVKLRFADTECINNCCR